MRLFACIPLLLLNTWCFADDRSASDSWFDMFSTKRDGGGFLAVGLALENQRGLYQSSGMKLRANVHGAYYFENGLFFEFPGLTDKFESQFALGYNLASTQNWEFDVILSTAHGSLVYRSPTDSFSKDTTPFWGLRAIGSIAGLDTMFVYGVNSNKMDYSGGRYAAAWLGKSWNINNWHIYSSLGAQYRNDAILDYYYGVPESSTANSPYQANGGFNLIYKLGFKKPLDENWVVEGGLSFKRYADAIIDSPYTQNILNNNQGRSDKGSALNLTISYVF